MASTNSFTHVLSTGYSSYVTDATIFNDCLVETFGRGIEFNISHFNERWSFNLNRQLSAEELESLADEVANRCQEAWRRARRRTRRPIRQ